MDAVIGINEEAWIKQINEAKNNPIPPLQEYIISACDRLDAIEKLRVNKIIVSERNYEPTKRYVLKFTGSRNPEVPISYFIFLCGITILSSPYMCDDKMVGLDGAGKPVAVWKYNISDEA